MSYEEIFCDINEPLDLKKAQIESSRCYYCYDAPCITACPTGIDIPSFIRKISNGNVKGAAMDIFSANIMGGTCARACPVETLCQKACVREKSEAKPVAIGQLQRFATDTYLENHYKKGEKPFTRSKSNGIKVAVVGAGPAGLSCAHKLAALGYDVTIFEANKKSGGLNEYGLAPYKLTNDFAQKEIEFILSIGGIKVEHGKALGKEINIADLQKQFSAVFLGVGLTGTNKLNIPGEEQPHVQDAVKFIANVRQTKDTKKLSVPKNVIVIGGGNTAVDAAIQSKRLGAEFVTLVYRRKREDMGATHHEQELAQKHGVLLVTQFKPIKINNDSIDFENTENGKTMTLKADHVLKAIGQTLSQEWTKSFEVAKGKLVVNETFETTQKNIFAGGDCVGPGEDLTVTAVQQGKLAALAIHKKLGAKNG